MTKPRQTYQTAMLEDPQETFLRKTHLERL